MTKVFSKPDSIYDTFERKGGAAPGETHYCPGCGHGTAHKLIAEAIDELDAADRSIMISPVGCSVFAYYYFKMGNIQAAHGRAPAVGTGVKRVRPESLVISYQGDGDLAAIGLNNIMQAANRGELMTVVFINNAIYGMTGGQMAPTTLPGQRTTTTPYGRDIDNEGYPMRMCEILSVLDAPVYIERVSLGTPKKVMKARRALQNALTCQEQRLGFSFVEILAACPTGWKMRPVDSLEWIESELERAFPLGVYCDRRKERESRKVVVPMTTPASVREAVFADAHAAGDTPRLKRSQNGDGAQAGGVAGNEPTGQSADSTTAGGFGQAASASQVAPIVLRVKVAGFGGQGILYLGETLAETAMEEGLRVSWLPSYGPEMRGGTAHCHVTLATKRIGSPMVERSTHLIAMNHPSLERFIGEVEPGGTVFYNSSLIEDPKLRDDVKAVAVPATEVAQRLGSVKAANMVMLGALLETLPWPLAARLTAELEEKATGRAANIMLLNRDALAAGAAYAREEATLN